MSTGNFVELSHPARDSGLETQDHNLTEPMRACADMPAARLISIDYDSKAQQLMARTPASPSAAMPVGAAVEASSRRPRSIRLVACKRKTEYSRARDAK